MDIFAGTSNVANVLAADLIPVIVFAYDPDPKIVDHLVGLEEKLSNTILVGDVSCHPSLYKWWKENVNEKVFHFIRYHTLDSETPVMPEQAFQKHFWDTIAQMYPYFMRIRSGMTTQSMAIYSAFMMGYKDVYLIGADHCFAEDKKRCSRVINGELEAPDKTYATDNIGTVKDWKGDKVETTATFLTYKAEIDEIGKQLKISRQKGEPAPNLSNSTGAGILNLKHKELDTLLDEQQEMIEEALSSNIEESEKKRDEKINSGS